MSVRIESQAEPIHGYRLIERLGSGGFGEVWKAEAPGGIFKAIKIVHGDLRNRETDAYRFAEQELKALKRVQEVRHPYLLALDRYDIVDGRLMITMELADCNLWDRFRVCRKQGLPGIPRDELLRYMSETAEVLDLFNSKFQLQHLDIKPQNLFLLHDHVKVADFGQVKDLQGLMAQVTGGITPVYAAPETFDGFVSRFCDQYSLACVYQELLTGHRPFDGTSMQQLLMQHLQMPPNLNPSPSYDRPALQRALAKKPDERFPNVMAMVNALRTGGGIPRSFGGSTSEIVTAIAAHSTPGPETSPSERIEVYLTADGLTPTGMPSQLLNQLEANGSSLYAAVSTPGYGPVELTPSPRSAMEPSSLVDQVAPPEQTGTGSLRPTLIVGLGYTGMRVLQRFRKGLSDRYGPSDKTPLIRTLYIDTDPEALASSTTDQSWAGLAGLRDDEVYPAKLHRAAHYLKPRLNGRTLLEGWFDPSLLYRLPRNPVTLGMRLFGRLAFCDHYRTLVHKLHSELETCLDPQSMMQTQLSTGLQMQTNRPRVYVVAGLGGGTGSGMFLDMAYALRIRLRRLGYTNPELIGILLTPPDVQSGDITPQAQANTYAALTELHHFNRSETVFNAVYDERSAPIRETEPPFSRVYLLPGMNHPLSTSSSGSSLTPVATTNRGSGTQSNFTSRSPGPINHPAPRSSGSLRLTPNSRRSGSTLEQERTPPVRRSDGDDRDCTTLAADYLRLHLFTQLGPLVDNVRPAPSEDTPNAQIQTFGMTRFTWPRAELVARTARILAPVLVNHWVSPDPAQVRQVIPAWANEQWKRIGLEPDQLAAHLTQAADQAMGLSVKELIANGIEQLVPKRWLTRSPDLDKAAIVINQWQKILGRPNTPANRGSTPLEDALADAADELTDMIKEELTTLFPSLIETPLFRLAGTEEAIRQVLGILDRTRIRHEQISTEREAEAGQAIDQLLTHVNYHKGMRKLTASEFADAVRSYPHAQHQQLLAKAVVRICRQLKDFLVALLSEVTGCRQRVELCVPELTADTDLIANPHHEREFLPAGCSTTEDAVQVFLQSLTDDDLNDLDQHVQQGLELKFGGLYQACLNTTDGHSELLKVVREQTRAYLDHRLGEVDLAGMLFTHFGAKSKASGGLQQAFEDAAPKLIGNGPWSLRGINVFVGPTGDGGDPIRDIAADALPDGTIDATTHDEVVIYREYPEIPLVAVSQLGPMWSNAYRAAPELQQVTPHTRLDVTQWSDVDAPHDQ